MKAEKNGGNSTKIATVKCTICGIDMGCVESMLRLLISTGTPPPFLGDLEEARNEVCC